jgi:hypothetical protein
MTIGVKIKQIKKIQTLQQEVKVYDIEVEDAHHYILDDGTLSHNSYVPTQEQGGGAGIKYAASTIIYLSKKKEKDGTEVVGNIIKAKAVKSRLSRENREVEMRLYYDERGLDRYYGLLPLAVEGGIIERVGNRYVFGEKKFWEKEILKNPETFFTQDVLEQIDVYAQKKFKYGSSLTVENDEEEPEE